MKTIEEFTNEHGKLLRQEELILEATELISKIMNDNEITKTELAKRLGKSKAFVTQCLGGSQNLTLRTLADMFTVTGYKACFGAETCSATVKSVHRLYPVKSWAVESQRCGMSAEIDLAAGADELPEEVLCDVA